MRFASVVIFAAACGGSSKPAEPPKQPAPAPAPAVAPAPKDEMVNVVWDEAKLGPAPTPVADRPAPPPKPAQPPAPPIYDRLHDEDGAVAGLTGFATKRVRDPKRCGGFAVQVKRAKKVAPSDAKLVAIYALEFPVDLDFSETKKAGSMLKFNTWVEKLTKTAADANTYYQGQFASTDTSVKVAATARLAQVNFRAASVIARAEIPTDIRSHEFPDEARTAYCETLAEKAEPLITLANQALDACQRHAASAPAAWWADLCKKP